MSDAVDDRAGVEELVDYLRAVCGFDLSGYKRGTLTRRIQTRLTATDCGTYAESRITSRCTAGSWSD